MSGASLECCIFQQFAVKYKSLRLKLRDEGISIRGTTLIGMLFRPEAVSRKPADRCLPFARKITYPLKGFCSRVRHLTPYTASHQPAALWNTCIKLIPFIASLFCCGISCRRFRCVLIYIRVFALSTALSC